ncbi:MAG: 4Fe-4S binding protein [Syntrophotaleaceae bacterium]
MLRNIVKIDEEKCNGCGLCVPACAEGAIQIVDGKARLVADNLCDGLGACLGDCPKGAITIEQRDADEFDETEVKKVQEKSSAKVAAKSHHGHGGCPSSRLMKLESGAAKPSEEGASRQSRLGTWPVQLSLVPPSAPFLENSDLLLAADCAPFAYADFHRDFLNDKTLVIGCPKLDDGQAYLEKLTRMLQENTIRSLTVIRMEVPCCSGLVAIAQQALAASGKQIPLETVTIGIKGERK